MAFYLCNKQNCCTRKLLNTRSTCKISEVNKRPCRKHWLQERKQWKIVVLNGVNMASLSGSSPMINFCSWICTINILRSRYDCLVGKHKYSACKISLKMLHKGEILHVRMSYQSRSCINTFTVLVVHNLFPTKYQLLEIWNILKPYLHRGPCQINYNDKEKHAMFLEVGVSKIYYIPIAEAYGAILLWKIGL